jgi:serine/threonine protein kinase
VHIGGAEEITMSPMDINTPNPEQWKVTTGRRGTNAIVPPLHVNSEDVAAVVDTAPRKDERATLPYGRKAQLDHELPEEPVGVAGVAASETPAPLSEVPETRSISDAVFHQTRIAKYELTGMLGHGSFGMVYTARDVELDREVALKILKPSHHNDEDAMHRFLREARAAARIAHPGIITVHDFGRHAPEDDEELAYIAMERLSGESLTDRLARLGALAPEVAAEIARQVAAALEAAHRADVLHRDLKPDNVYLVPDPAVPSGERAKVFDFGLAKIGTSRHTRMGSVFGTPLYMSPEQCRSAGDTDARSDIYALGCILFEMLAGSAPFEGAIFQVIQRHLHEAAPRVSSLMPDVPPALDALVAEMLDKDPTVRPQTMADVVKRLEDVIAALRVDWDRYSQAEVAAAVSAAVAASDVLREPAGADAEQAAGERATASRAASSAMSDAMARPEPPPAELAQEPGRGSHRWIVIALAIAITLAIAASLALMTKHRGSGLDDAGSAQPAAPAAPASSR